MKNYHITIWHHGHAVRCFDVSIDEPVWKWAIDYKAKHYPDQNVGIQCHPVNLEALWDAVAFDMAMTTQSLEELHQVGKRSSTPEFSLN